MRLAVTSAWFALACSQILSAQESITQPPVPAIRQKNRFSGRDQSFSRWLTDVKRSRTRLADFGITTGLVITNDFSDDVRGGAEPDSDFNRCLLDLSLTFDGHKLIGWSGGSAFVRMHSYIGENGSDYVGDAQGFSNVDDDSHTLLYELWAEQKLPGTNWRARVGKIDANTLFATVENGADFLNSSMGYSPTIMQLPTYPRSGLEWEHSI
jgi:carbohydrate-selective porin OprB